MGNCREVEIKSRSLRVYEHEDLLDPGTGKCYAGSWVWDCALVLSHWLDKVAALNPGMFEGKRVVELGAGTGLPGLVASVHGAEVVLTDKLELLPGLRRNIEENDLQGRVRAQVYEWGKDCKDLAPPVDYILMSDVLYDIDSTPSLCKSLLDLSDERTQILLAYELRPGTTDCFKIMRNMMLQWTRVPKEELDPGWQSEDIGIFRVWRRSEGS
ncbi:hypothetical protein O6H91_05G018200 [Diphasiastrum complanatum]|uniref:Uncharacterized protein n=1 Tax=Diphasiastrum complanatum TaxID=34168 RepID=A0ACC2DKZ1_DIPCM|nr:hypothetical protein O6H91_05G018200 [Diphasiastrum complanatum]